MEECKNCRKQSHDGIMLACPNCGATLCPGCAGLTQGICPYCYSTLDYFV
ncbi:MAG: hypothetical protein VZQ61_02095 [Christensenellaceae bacterium]